MSRTYEQYCPVARALEHVGERWTMLVARELLLGPRRFTDLMDGLPGISTNLLTIRLKELEDAGLVARRELPPPAASTVYELTDEAAGLVRVLATMADWGMELLGRPRKGEEVRGAWLVLSLAATVMVEGIDDSTVVEIRAGDDVTQLRVDGGHLAALRGPADTPDAIIALRPRTLGDLALGEIMIARALSDGDITIEGDRTSARRLLEAFRGTA